MHAINKYEKFACIGSQALMISFLLRFFCLACSFLYSKSLIHHDLFEILDVIKRESAKEMQRMTEAEKKERKKETDIRI